MNIKIRNTAFISNKYIRFIKWKIYALKRKFNHLEYAEVFIQSEGQSSKEYLLKLILGIKGKDLFIKTKSNNIGESTQVLLKNAHLKLADQKSRR